MKKTALFLSLAATLLAAQPALAKWTNVGKLKTCPMGHSCPDYANLEGGKASTALFKNGEKIDVIEIPHMTKFTPPFNVQGEGIITKGLYNLQITCPPNGNEQGYTRKANLIFITKKGKSVPYGDGEWSQEPDDSFAGLCRKLMGN